MIDGGPVAFYSQAMAKKVTPRPWLEARIRDVQKTKIDLARALGVNNSRVHELIAGTRRVQLGEIDPMARFLEWTREQLLKKLAIPGAEGSDAENLHVDLGYGGAFDLPVYGAIDMGAGLFSTSENPDGFTERPPSLRAIVSAYAVWCTQDVMSPAFDRGDLIVIDPTKPIVPGNDVLFIDTAGRRCIRRLVDFSTDGWKVRQMNPPRTYSITSADWPTAHKVFGIRKR